jgi:hypothetical protein
MISASTEAGRIGIFHASIKSSASTLLYSTILIEGVPKKDIRAVGETTIRMGNPVFLKNISLISSVPVDIAFLRHPAIPIPKAVPVDEKVYILRVIPL